MSTAMSASYGARGDGPIRSALMLARDALACDWVAIAQAKNEASLMVIDSSSDAQLLELDLSGLGTRLDKGDFVDLGRSRVSSAWTMVCGRRPALGWIGPVPDSSWTLVAAFAEANKNRERLHLALAQVMNVLAGLFHRGGRARAERVASERMAELVRHVESPVVFLDNTESTVFMNPAASNLLLIPQAEYSVGKVTAALRRIFAGLRVNDGRASSDMFNEGPQPFQIGAAHWEVRARRIDSPALSGWLWLFNDTTAVVGQQRLIMESLRVDTMERIIGGVAHQFNNLLTVVLGGAEMASLDPALAPHLRQTLDQVMMAADRGADIVAQLHSFGRRRLPGQGQHTIALAPALAALLPVLEGLVVTPASLRLLPVEDGMVVQSNPEPFAEVMVNLVLNARDAVTGAGAITVSAEAMVLSEEQAGALALQFQDAVVIRVHDTGVGMSEDVLSRAFEPVFTTRGMASARGLGLSVVQGWVGAAGGCARIESAPGVGTMVELVLPRQRPYPDAGQSRRDTEPPGTGWR